MHVYFHVPFCARRCSYCDFAIAVRKEIPSDAYATAVLREWGQWQSEPAWNGSADISTIYFGGGTPSRLDPAAIERILERIRRDRAVASDAELTLEANPEDVTLARAAAWRDAGINRISLGVQSFHPTVLAWMHRTHTADQVFRAVDALHCAGLTELSLDLIFGLPAALERDWSSDLAQAFALNPDHLSLYGLTLEAGTPLARWTDRGAVVPVEDDRYAAEFLEAHRELVHRGYEHYEVSNAARPGHRARHNSAYWRRAPFVGLGPSAHSGYGSERRWNVREWAGYERLMVAGGSPIQGREHLSSASLSVEKLYLGLRTIDGVQRTLVPAATSDSWVDAGWAKVAEDRLILTPEGWLRLDALVASVRS
jgi:oxygen-independent coproporphyrinogen III oxidase